MDDARFWDRMAKRYDASPRSRTLQWAIEDALRQLGPEDVVLDLGCGSGPVARELASRVKAVHGIDISAKMIELAKPHEGDGLTFHLANLDDPSLDGRGFTTIVAFNVLHFLDHTAYQRMAGLLPAGGKLLVQAACVKDVNPFIRAVLAVVGGLAGMPKMDRFTIAQLRERLVAAGFEITDEGLREEWANVWWLAARRR